MNTIKSESYVPVQFTGTNTAKMIMIRNRIKELYACYKCINIDYDHSGTYAATEMQYSAKIDDSNSLECRKYNSVMV